ncbi:hypothetical protein [Streptomyces sp. NBC_01187]|uniref:hypothetical protein n=1 Tax=Streptomyces sp. NBC_01187 TaxID=2903766 RepID=UPI002F90C340|nr:hypothetical protein OG220_42250 [Streptomyces sp. NBC_01187]
MPFYEEPNWAPFHATELTEADVKAVKAFLDARVRELRGRHHFGSDESRMARALTLASGVLIDELGLHFQDDEPETLDERKRAWNRVIFTVWPWEGHDDFDPQRWRLVRHRDVEHAHTQARGKMGRLEQKAALRSAGREDA